MQSKEQDNKLIIGKDIELFLSQNTFLTIHNNANRKFIVGDSNIPYHGFQSIVNNYFDPKERDICLDIFLLGNLCCSSCKAQVSTKAVLSHKKALANFFKATNSLPEDYTFGSSNVSFNVKPIQAVTLNHKQCFSLRGRSNKKNFLAGVLVIGETSIYLEDASKNCYILEPSIDLYPILFNADEESRKYLMTSLAWILLVKKGFRSYLGKDIFHYPLPEDKTNRKANLAQHLGTYTLTSSLLKNLIN